MPTIAMVLFVLEQFVLCANLFSGNTKDHVCDV